jgi:hypothetical protein
MIIFIKKIILAYFIIFTPFLFPSLFIILGIGFWQTWIGTTIVFILLWLPFAIFLIKINFLKHEKKAKHDDVLFFVVFLVMAIPTMYISHEMRQFGFYVTALRAQPIIDATQQYFSNNTKINNYQTDLIPEYLNSIPYGVPEFSISGNNEKWRIYIDASQGVFAWDKFIYISNGDYSEYGLSITKHNGWIYYHE